VSKTRWRTNCLATTAPENPLHKSPDVQGQVVKLSRDGWETTI
jgi:hypothetical protein